MTVMNTNSTPEEQPKKNKPKMKKVPVENRQQVSIKSIVVDYDLQSRVEMSTEHTIMIGKRIADGLGVDPVIVFFDGKKYWLADGFHRIKAHIKAGLDFIWAYVKQGTKRDAMIYSAGANQQFSLERKPEDIKKAVFMLLADPEWFMKSAKEIGDHCGVSNSTAARFFVRFCEENGIVPPESVVDKNGRHRPRSIRHHASQSMPKITKTGDGWLRARINKEYIYLGKDMAAAEQKLAQAMRGHNEKRRSLSYGTTHGFLATRIAIRPASFPPQTSCYGHVFRDISITTSDLSNPSDFVAAVGRAALIRQQNSPGGRAVILGYPFDAHGDISDLIPLAKSLGIEFMTPDEFIASVTDNA